MSKSRNDNDHNPRASCGDCGVEEGEYHVLGCDCERCPFCSGQLISCDCCYQLLNLFDRGKYDDSTAYLPPDIYRYGLAEEQGQQWDEMLRKKGRIPFILYPLLCAKCGKLWPEFFRVPDEEWNRYIQPDKQRQVICRDCYEYVKDVITKAKHERASMWPANE
jgi:hypothetical protein